MCTPRIPQALADVHAFEYEDLGYTEEGSYIVPKRCFPVFYNRISKSTFLL